MPRTTSFWMDNAISKEGEPPAHTLVDLGYVRCPAVIARGTRLAAMIGKGNLEVVGFGRLLARIPPTKVDRILDLFPQIKPKSMTPGYSWTTHSWLDPESTDLKFAAT